MKHTFIFFIIFNYNLNAQNNLIRNGGFENGTRIYSRMFSQPEDYSSNNQPLNGCDYWSSAIYNNGECDKVPGEGLCPTSDWWDPQYINTIPTTAYQGLPPLNTNKCAGIVIQKNWNNSNKIWPEGIRTELTKSLVPNKYYKLKLRMAIGNQSNPTYSNIGKEAGIRIHFSKWGPNWNAGTLLTSNVKWIDAIKFKIPANSQHQWYNFEEYFRMPEEVDGGSSSELSNIIITQSDASETESYLFIDDVELIEYDPCNNPCSDARLFLPIKVFCCGNTWEFPVFHEAASNRPWNFKTENAMEIKIEITDRWGGIFLTKLEYDPNVLDMKVHGNTGSSDYYQSFWDGKDDDGSLLPVSFSYPFIVTIKNCLETKIFSGNDITLLSHFLDPDVVLPPPIKINRIKNCCPEFAEIKDEIFNSQIHKKADSYLSVAGGNNVIINGTDLVKFAAGIEIELKDGFETMDNANFVAYCASCIESDNQKVNFPIVKNFYGIETEINIFADELQTNTLKNNDVVNELSSIYPNPIYNNKLNYKINLPSSDGAKYRVIDMYGSLKLEGSVIGNSGQIELNNLQSGMYIIEFSNKENKFNWITKFSKL